MVRHALDSSSRSGARARARCSTDETPVSTCTSLAANTCANTVCTMHIFGSRVSASENVPLSSPPLRLPESEGVREPRRSFHGKVRFERACTGEYVSGRARGREGLIRTNIGLPAPPPPPTPTVSTLGSRTNISPHRPEKTRIPVCIGYSYVPYLLYILPTSSKASTPAFLSSPNWRIRVRTERHLGIPPLLPIAQSH